MRGLEPGALPQAPWSNPASRPPKQDLELLEATRCLEDGTLRSASDGDIGAVMGLGFPPFRGGPFRAVDEMGAAQVVERLEALAESQGRRFTPSEILRQKAAAGETFHD